MFLKKDGLMKENKISKLIPMTNAESNKIHLLLVLSYLFTAFSCGISDVPSQIRTEGNMQTFVQRINNFNEERGRLPTEKEFRAEIANFGDNNSEVLDGWGQTYHYETLVLGDNENYILASYGRDGKRDVSDVREYLNMENQDVSGKYDSDIVVINGEYVLSAAK